MTSPLHLCNRALGICFFWVEQLPLKDHVKSLFRPYTSLDAQRLLELRTVRQMFERANFKELERIYL